nr:immunoglobulin light chain junction region [Macaca mulatta]MOV80015.1 immunoglobulin light chain junction region [Macaca mulatta]MOV85126.1 immunoglobulin light chain junction region [Macaca mulatta]MOV85219.1 immunoglobulin light chain junction region [Macaca mulatta]
CQQYYDLFWTF